MFWAKFLPIIRSTWLYLQYLVMFTQVAAGWCLFERQSRYTYCWSRWNKSKFSYIYILDTYIRWEGGWVWMMNWEGSGRRKAWWTIKCGTTDDRLGAEFYVWPSLIHNRIANHLTRSHIPLMLRVIHDTWRKFWTCDDRPDTQAALIQANGHVAKKFLKKCIITDMGWQTAISETRGLWTLGDNEWWS
jgi:hypothetical protein